jgi:hypothetical protein
MKTLMFNDEIRKLKKEDFNKLLFNKNVKIVEMKQGSKAENYSGKIISARGALLQDENIIAKLTLLIDSDEIELFTDNIVSIEVNE